MRESRGLTPQYKGTRAQEPLLQRGTFLMWYAGIDWADTHVRHVTVHDIPIMGQHWREMLKVMELTSR
jgi:hypothetical protein